MSKTVQTVAGMHLLLYKDKVIIFNAVVEKESTIVTPYEWFIGTKEQVDAHIKDLSLGVIKRPLRPKKTVPVEKMARVGIIRRTINFFKRLF